MSSDQKLNLVSEFCFCVRRVQQGRHITHKLESGWEVGVIKVFDKKGPHAGKFSVNYKDDPNWWTHRGVSFA
jgi:hypothetical protein